MTNAIGFYRDKHKRIRPITKARPQRLRYKVSTSEHSPSHVTVPKGENVSYTSAQFIHNKLRTPHAVAVDNALHASEKYPTGQEDYRPWTEKMNRSDIDEIDVNVYKRLPPKERPKEVPPMPPPEKPVAEGKHPIVVRGSAKVIDEFQPIADKRFKDLQGHDLTQREIAVAVGHLPSGVAGQYVAEPYMVDGKVYMKPVAIGVCNRVTNPHDRDETFTHEGIHFRRNVDKDSKLGKFFKDKDKEEKETVHETSARLGDKGITRTTNTSYYQYVKDPKYPTSRKEDLKTLDLHSDEGVHTNTKQIEKNILANQDRTHLNKVEIDYRKYPLDPRRVGASKPNKLSVPERVDEYYLQKKGRHQAVTHIYSPKGNANPKAVVKYIDKKDGKLRNEHIYQYRDGRLLLVQDAQRRN